MNNVIYIFSFAGLIRLPSHTAVPRFNGESSVGIFYFFPLILGGWEDVFKKTFGGLLATLYVRADIMYNSTI